jgi:4-diphosphocytidyl-2-C-methyl-D-erythritol kinase
MEKRKGLYIKNIYLHNSFAYFEAMKAKTYTVKSPAKINIGLYVLNKRSDGYHNIETIFYPIKAHDELRVKIQPSRKNEILVKTTPKLGIDDKNNICYRAVRLFFDEFKIKDKYMVEINIRKRIPIGAGLGGGSSNAAAVLKVLAKHFGVKNKTKLNKLALNLGSDVPFFMLGKPAYATSRGEKLTPLPKFKINYKILIVNPGIHVSTKDAYDSLDKAKNGGKKHVLSGAEGAKKLSKIKTFSINDADKFKNDFEEVGFKKYPAIKKIKDRMYKEGAAFSLMSGSGSSVFGLFKKLKRFEIKR